MERTGINNCVVNESVNKRVSFFQGDITRLEVDAIVNIVDSLNGGGIGLLALFMLYIKQFLNLI